MFECTKVARRLCWGLFAAMVYVSAPACGPAVVHAPTDMRDVPHVRLAPSDMAFEVEMPAEARARTSRERIEGFDEPAVSNEWTVQAADQTAVFSVAHVQYPAGLARDPRVIARMLDYVPEHVAESLHGRITQRRNVRAGDGVRGVAFRVTAPDRSYIEGQFMIRGDVGLLGFFAAEPQSRWRDAGTRMLRTLRFL